MSIVKQFKDSIKLNEQSRMDFNIFMKRVKEYMSRNNIDFNSVGMQRNEMQQAYQEGKYPSEFVKNYVKKQK